MTDALTLHLTADDIRYLSDYLDHSIDQFWALRTSADPSERRALGAACRLQQALRAAQDQALLDTLLRPVR